MYKNYLICLFYCRTLIVEIVSHITQILSCTKEQVCDYIQFVWLYGFTLYD